MLLGGTVLLDKPPQEFQCMDGFGGHLQELQGSTFMKQWAKEPSSMFDCLIFQPVILGLERLKASAEMTLKKAESKDLGIRDILLVSGARLRELELGI